MKKVTTLLLAALLAGSLACNAAVAGSNLRAFVKGKSQTIGHVPGMSTRTATAVQLKAAGMPTVKYGLTMPSDEGPTATVQAGAFGYLTGPDGSIWYYTQELKGDSVDTGFGYKFLNKYTGSSVKIYNDNNELVGSFDVEMPTDKKVNQIEPYGYVTNKFFDKDESTYEVTVGLHWGDGGVAGWTTQAYSLSTGKVVWEKEGASSGVYIVKEEDAFSTYQRLYFQRDGDTTTNFDIVAPVSWNHDEPYIEQTFTIDDDLCNYVMGAPFNAYSANGKIYYILSHYAKAYASGEDTAEDIVVTDSNKFVIETYECSKKYSVYSYNKVDSFAIALSTPADALYHMAGFGLLSDKDLSYDYFVPGKRAYVVYFSDYYVNDNYETLQSFVVYDQDGNEIKTLCDNIYEDVYFELSPIKGYSDQMAFLQISGTDQQIQLVDIPSGEKSTLIPATLAGQNISSIFDRYPVGDSYQFVMKLAQGDVDDDGNLIAQIGWFTRDLELDHMVNINLGLEGETFSPLLNSTSLNPYVFDTDDDIDYLYLAKKDRNDGSGKIATVLEIAHSDGTVFKQFASDDEYTINQPALAAVTNIQNRLIIPYQGDSDWKIDMYDLPFTKFGNGGDGTAENPYQVATAGDLSEMRNYPNAHFTVINDIDMTGMSDKWVPVRTFNGTLEGNNHVISNFYSTTASPDGYQGLFGKLDSAAIVKDITFLKPMVTTSSESCGYMGVVAGNSMYSTLENIHVFEGDLSVSETDCNPTIGGIIANPTLETKVYGCSFEGTIDASNSSGVGGISGSVMSGSTVQACYAKGTFSGKSELGGIAGDSFESFIYDCHSDVDLTGSYYIGGIAGSMSGRSGSGPTRRCYAKGTITSTSTPNWGLRSLGGITGMLAGSYSFNENYPYYTVDACVSGVNINIENKDTAKEDSTKDNAVHRLVGWTAYNEWEAYLDGSDPYVEKAIHNSYALSTVSVDGTTAVAVENDSTNTVYGKTIEAKDINSELLTSISYVYGDSIQGPWTGKNGLPKLYYENTVHAITLDNSELVIDLNATKDIVATIYGGDVESVEAVSSDPNVATVAISSYGDNTATITVTMKAEGTATITVTADDCTASCTVIDTTTGISNVTTENSSLTINITEGSVSAAGAQAIALYSADGKMVAAVAGDTIGTTQLAAGVYVAVATDAQGNKATAKFVVR